MAPLAEKRPYVKIFGERNSGTNYLETLINHNFIAQQLRGGHGKIVLFMKALGKGSAEAAFFHDLEMRRLQRSEFGWKHASPPLADVEAAEHTPHTLFILLAKHPVFWLKSLHARPYRRIDKTLDFAAFIRTPFPLSEADGLGDIAVQSPVHMLRLKIEGYMRLEDRQTTCVRMQYERLLSDFEAELDRLSPYLLRRGDGFVNLDTGVKNQRETLGFYKSKYDLTKVSDGIDAETLTYIRDVLGTACLSYFGYEL